LDPIGKLGDESLVYLFAGAKHEIFEGSLRGRSLPRPRIAQF
jgi:hypothetical protein